ncbi:ribosome maturation factor RimP [Parelusimicrobium proximum]|uniref:ribosome maturation factor RimP n=1 Tax=Parelusimicrobium proximum TaxID=3228953 RepID=UPI003D16D207
MKDIKSIEEIVFKALEPSGIELIDLIVQNQGRKKLFQFFVDKEGGVNLDELGKISHQIDSIIEMEELIDGAYILEVSSPGYKRVLKRPAHFKKFVGERAKIMLKQAVDNRAMFTGVIESADDNGMTLDDGTNKFTFKYEDIKKANLDPVAEF